MDIQTSTERLTLLDKVNVCLQDFGDHVMHLVFDIEGQINLDRMQRAVYLSLIQHPIMAQRLMPGWFRYRWQRWDNNRLEQFPYCDLLTTDTPEECIHDFLIREFDFQKQPMVKLAVIRSPNQEHDTLCVKVSCVPIDGRGFLIYCESLLSIYEKLKYNPLFIPEKGNVKTRSTKDLIPYFSPIDALKLVFFGLKNQLTDARTAHNWAFPFRNHPKIKKSYYCYQFKEQTFSQVRGLRRLYNLTFNDILLGAYYCSLQEIIQPTKNNLYCVLNTYDLRRQELNPQFERVANYSSFVNSNVPLNENVDFIATCKQVKQALDQRKAHYPGMTEGPFILPLFSCLPFAISSRVVKALLKHRGERIPVFTNVGIIPCEKMRINGAPISNVRPFAPLEFPPKLTVTLATAGNTITLSVGFSKNHFDENKIHQLFSRMETLIQKAHTNGIQAAA